MDKHGYVRDKKSGAIVNADANKFSEYMHRRKEKKKSQDLEKRIDMLESSIITLMDRLEKLENK